MLLFRIGLMGGKYGNTSCGMACWFVVFVKNSRADVQRIRMFCSVRSGSLLPTSLSGAIKRLVTKVGKGDGA